MKRSIILSLFLLLLPAAGAVAQNAAPILPVTKGVYRLPYESATKVFVSNDHTDHNPKNRFDLRGTGTPPSGSAYLVVASAAGWIEYLQDSNSWFCPRNNGDCDGYSGPSANCCLRTDSSCNANCRNNYIWIRHPNGEWSKYTHIQTGSATSRGRSVGEFVNAGTALGLQGDVGFATGPHLHFEVAVPDNVDLGDPDPLGIGPASCQSCGVPGSSDGFSGVDRQNRIPVFCQLGFLERNETYTSIACDDHCNQANFTASGTVEDNDVFYEQASASITTANAGFIVETGAGAALRAGNKVTLRPGFRAQSGSFFSASIGACDTPGGS